MGIKSIALEDIACVLILMFYGVAGALPGIAPNQASEMTGTRGSGLMFVAGVGSQLLVNAMIAALLLLNAPQLLRKLKHMRWCGALAGFALLSALWSQEPFLTGRRAVPFALAALFGLYLAVRRPLRRQLVLFEAAFLLLALGSALLAIGFPRLGLDASTGHAGNWQGVFTQKNACGRAMVFASAVVLARGRLNLRRAASLLVFLFVLGMSGSRGAWVIEALLLSMVSGYAFVRRFVSSTRTLLILAWLGASATALVVGKIYFAVLTRLVGRDPTLTGRTAIWAQVWISILKRPWLGYGFSAFWRGAKGASFDVVVALKFVLFHAHNGFLEIWLELGAAGLLLFALSYLRGWYQLWPQITGSARGSCTSAPANVSKNAAGTRGFDTVTWGLCILLLIAVYDLDENTLLSFNGLFWVLYVHALVTIEVKAERNPTPIRAARHGVAVWPHARPADPRVTRSWDRQLEGYTPWP